MMKLKDMIKKHSSKIAVFCSLAFTFFIALMLIEWIKNFADQDFTHKVEIRSNTYFERVSIEPEILKKGREIFYLRCTTCHGYKGNAQLYKGKQIPELYAQDYERLYLKIGNGKSKQMPRYKNRLVQEDLDSVVAYTYWLLKNKK